MYKIISSLIISILIFSIGVFTGYKFVTPKEIIKEVEVIKNIDRPVYRDYEKSDCCEIAKRYDTDFMQIKYKVNSMNIKYTDLDVTWKLYDRNGMQNVKVPVYQSGNFKFYLGLGIGAGIIGGLGYAILK